MKPLQGTIKFYRPIPGYSDGILENRSYSGSKVKWNHSPASDQVDDDNTKRRMASFKTSLSKVFCSANRGDNSTWEISIDGSDPNSSFKSTENNRAGNEGMDRHGDHLPVSPSFSCASDVSQHVNDWSKPANLSSPRDVRNVNALCPGDCSPQGMIKPSTQVFISVVPQYAIKDGRGERCPHHNVEVGTGNRVKISLNKGSIERRRLELERKRKSLEGRISAIRSNYSSFGTLASHESIRSSESSHGSTRNSSKSGSSDKVLTNGHQGNQMGVAKEQIDKCKDPCHKAAHLTFVDHLPNHPVEIFYPGCRQRPQHSSTWKLEVSPKVPFYYSGSVAHGCLPHGRGLMKFANGDTYVGTFKHGQMHGSQAVYVWSNGSVYKGDFVNNIPHGHGDYKMDDERRYVGNFEHGMLSGYGEAYFEDGTVFHKGQWVNGIPDHKYVPFIRDGKGDQSSRLSIPVACDASSASTDDPSMSIYARPSAVGRHEKCLSRYVRPFFSEENEDDSTCSKSCISIYSDSSSASSEHSAVISRTVSIHLAVRRLRKRIDMLEQERRIHAEQEL